MTERQQFATIMENEAAPTGGRLASPEVIGGKSNRHSGEKGAPQAPFFHAFFRVAAGEGTCGEPPRRFLRRGGGVGCCGGGDVASGRALRGRFGRKGRGGRLFFMSFFWGARGAGFAEGACRGDGICRGGGQERGRRSGGRRVEPRRSRAVFCCLGDGAVIFRGGRLFLGEGIVWGKPCGERRAAESGAAAKSWAAGSGELGRRALWGRWRAGGGKGGGGGEGEKRERGWGSGEKAGGGGKKEEAFGNFAERFVSGLICLRQGSRSV